jgi:hypothetical protein
MVWSQAKCPAELVPTQRRQKEGPLMLRVRRQITFITISVSDAADIDYIKPDVKPVSNQHSAANTFAAKRRPSPTQKYG